MSRFEQKGFNWALNEAKSAELSRLAKFAEGIISPTDWDRWFTMCNDAHTAAERLFFVLNPDQDGEREAAATFWGEHLDDRSVKEFAAGALRYLDIRDAPTLAI